MLFYSCKTLCILHLYKLRLNDDMLSVVCALGYTLSAWLACVSFRSYGQWIGVWTNNPTPTTDSPSRHECKHRFIAHLLTCNLLITEYRVYHSQNDVLSWIHRRLLTEKIYALTYTSRVMHWKLTLISSQIKTVKHIKLVQSLYLLHLIYMVNRDLTNISSKILACIN